MNKKNSALLTIALVFLLTLSAIAAYFFWAKENQSSKEAIRIACVGDSLTQSTEYPCDLSTQLGTKGYTVRNFGAGSTTVSLKSETPYINTTVFQDALEFQPNIIIIMLGTNDAQPSLHPYNATFIDDYLKLVDAFKGLSSNPKIWVVLPPPIFSDQSGKMDPGYFTQTIIPAIEHAANQTNLPIIDVYSALDSHPDYFPDGVHADSAAAKIIADTIYKAIKR